MITIELNSYEEANQFSDWRLYVESQSSCCGLAPCHQEGLPSFKKSYTWHSFSRLSNDMRLFVVKLLEICSERKHWESFLVELEFPQGDLIRYRVQELGGIYALKKLTSKTMDLSELQGVTDSVRKFITDSSWRQKGGLVLMVGDASVGKSLFTAAAMRERLKLYGGYCLVLGDPPEHTLGDNESSFVGDYGYVDYVDVSSIGYTQALVHSLRTYPMYKKGSLLFSEIRSDVNASDLINTAANGHLIFATLHAKSPDAALDRLISWTLRTGLTVEIIRNMIASTLLGMTYHSVQRGSYVIDEFPCTESVAIKIRQGHPLPFQAGDSFRSPGRVNQ